MGSAGKEITAQAIANLVENNIGRFFSTVKGLAKREVDKTKVDLSLAFTSYLRNATEKYSYIKTLLMMETPKYIYDFYECNHIKNKEAEIDVHDINHLLDHTHYAIITGTGGIGKSTMLKHFFLNAIENTDLIPLMIELRDSNAAEGSLFDCIYTSLQKLGFSLSEELFRYALETGCFCILLDGYDEINGEHDIASEIEDLCDEYGDNYFIVTSRPSDTFISWHRFHRFQALPFTKEQALSLIRKIDYDPDTKAHFLDELDKTLYDKHQSFASNPLLLNIMLLTFENYAEIPDKLHIFYANAFDALLSRHDATKGSYKRILKSGLSKELFIKVITEFSFKTYAKRKFSFNKTEIFEIFRTTRILDNIDLDDCLYDMIVNVCILYLDGLKYQFTHRSFQEYFTALFIKDLPDTQQKNVCKALISKDYGFLRNDSVFHMLYEMNAERLEKNIIIPFLRQMLKQLDKAENPRDHLFRTLYSGIRFASLVSNDSGEEKLRFYFPFKNNAKSFYLPFTLDIYHLDITRDCVYDWDRAVIGFATEQYGQQLRSKAVSYRAINEIPCFMELITAENGYFGMLVERLQMILTMIEERHKSLIRDIDNLFV